MEERIRYLKGSQYSLDVLYDTDFGDAFKMVAFALEAYNRGNAKHIEQLSVPYQKFLTQEIEALENQGLKKIIRITNPRYFEESYNSGYEEQVDASRKTYEYNLLASVLQMYVDVHTGEWIYREFDDNALFTIGISRRYEGEGEPEGEAQLEYFYIDAIDVKTPEEEEQMSELLGDVATSFAQSVDAIEAQFNRMDAQRAYRGNLSRAEQNASYDNYLGALFVVLVSIVAVPVLAFLALPRPLQIVAGVGLVVLIVLGLNKLNKTLFQKMRKKKILRYSDAMLRDSIHTELQKSRSKDAIDVSVGRLFIASLRVKKGLNVIKVKTTVSKKYLRNDAAESEEEKITLTLKRSRYPERRRNKGIKFKEEICPSCGKEFDADEKQCCKNCGYGLVHRRFTWYV